MTTWLPSFIIYWRQSTMEGVTDNCKKCWLAVEGTTYRGRDQSVLCAEMTLMFEAFLGCAPIISWLIYAWWYDPISMPNTIPLDIKT